MLAHRRLYRNGTGYTIPAHSWSQKASGAVLETGGVRWQGQADEAQDVARRFREAWHHADVTLTASRF